MHFKGLSVWITTPEGDPLSEYKTTQKGNNVIECWIPSTEGTNFMIEWSVLKAAKPGYELRCAPNLDGVATTTSVLSAQQVIGGAIDIREGQRTGPRTRRPFCFGKRELTDNENIAPLNKKLQEDLNTIRLRFQWGHKSSQKIKRTYTQPKVNGPIHEKVAKKGHAGSVGFGKTVRCRESSGYYRDFEVASHLEALVFVFRYAPKDWLKAKEIIPSTSYSTARKRIPSSLPKTAHKRARGDITETDDDDIVIVKHMIPASAYSDSKRRKIKYEENATPRLNV